MKYRVVLDREILNLTDENLVAALSIRGHELCGWNRNPRQRAELQGQPRFNGLCGPMWDGDAVRYESQAVYDRLSN